MRNKLISIEAANTSIFKDGNKFSDVINYFYEYDPKRSGSIYDMNNGRIDFTVFDIYHNWTFEIEDWIYGSDTEIAFSAKLHKLNEEDFIKSFNAILSRKDMQGTKGCSDADVRSFLLTLSKLDNSSALTFMHATTRFLATELLMQEMNEFMSVAPKPGFQPQTFDSPQLDYKVHIREFIYRWNKQG